MNALIITSASDLIAAKYLDVANKVADFVAKQEFDLIFGASVESMMGECYQKFKENNRTIYSYTTPKYQDQFKRLPDTKHRLKETTFDLKKDMFNQADIVICLPGGIGTYSEILSFLEEKRSNNKRKPVIIYNENGFYDNLLKIFDDLIERKFLDKNIYDNFILVNDFTEFKESISNIRRIMK